MCPTGDLLEAIRPELRTLRARHERSNFDREHLRLLAVGPPADAVTVDAKAVILNRSHPWIERVAVEFDRDPEWVHVLASHVWREEIVDADEQAF